MTVKKKYSLTNKRTIWRLIPSGDKLLVEERDENDRQVYFNCVEIESGKCILENFQLDEKYWAGVEAFEGDRIYFHWFVKPDMPDHIGIIAFDLKTKRILWMNEDLVFHFLAENEVFAFIQKFESRYFFSLDTETGKITREYGEDAGEINELREKTLDKQYEKYRNYLFPEVYIPGKLSSECGSIIENIKMNDVITGTIEYVNFENLLIISYHTVKDDGKMNNKFMIIEIDSGMIIFKELINSGITSYIPDSFFVKDKFLFLIKDKTELMVFSLN